MRVMVMVKATRDSEAGKMPAAELIEAMGRFNQELMDAGVFVDGGGLRPTSKGARVRFSGPGRTVTNGPFGVTEELVAGYWIWNVASLQDAIEWVRKCPNPMPGDSDIEIRPLFEMEDFL